MGNVRWQLAHRVMLARLVIVVPISRHLRHISVLSFLIKMLLAAHPRLEILNGVDAQQIRFNEVPDFLQGLVLVRIR